MGILENLIQNVKDQKIGIIRKNRTAKVAKSGKSNGDTILFNDSEVERLSKYIADKWRKKIITINSGIRYGIDKIGTKGDSNDVLQSNVLAGATKKGKRYAAQILVKKWGRDNLVEVIKTKSGKEIIGKMISKNTYIKTVSYTRKGKTISYLQGRNIKTGQVIAYKTINKLIGKIK